MRYLLSLISPHWKSVAVLWWSGAYCARVTYAISCALTIGFSRTSAFRRNASNAFVDFEAVADSSSRSFAAGYDANFAPSSRTAAAADATASSDGIRRSSKSAAPRTPSQTTSSIVTCPQPLVAWSTMRK